MHIHINQLRSKRTTKRRSQVARLKLEGRSCPIRTDNDTEILNIVSTCMEIRRRWICIVAGTIVVVRGIGYIKNRCSGCIVIDYMKHNMSSRARWAYGNDI